MRKNIIKIPEEASRGYFLPLEAVVFFLKEFKGTITKQKEDHAMNLYRAITSRAAMLLILVLIPAFLIATNASAITYNYSGSTFTVFGGDTATNDQGFTSIQGSVTLNDALPWDTSGAFITVTPADFYFTNGFASIYLPQATNHTITATFNFITSAGTITDWDIELTDDYDWTGGGEGVASMSLTDYMRTRSFQDYTSYYFFETFSEGSYEDFHFAATALDTSGSWSVPASVPEPASLVLLGLGLLGLCGWGRKKFKSV